MSAVRTVLILGLFVTAAAAIYLYMVAPQEGSEGKSVPASTIDTEDTERWPWKLQRALDTAGLDWEDVPGRVYSSKKMCERHRSEIMKTTNRLHRCERR